MLIEIVNKRMFFEVVNVANTNTLTFKKEICNVLNQYNLFVKNLREWRYYGANNIRGEWSGLKTLVLKDCLHGYYVHYFTHRCSLL